MTTVTVAACVTIVLMVGITLVLWYGSREQMHISGWSFLFRSDWNPVTGKYGALSSIYGTLSTTAIALVVALPLSLMIALFLFEMAPPWLATLVGGAVELLAAIPSIIYGMWGLFIFSPYMSDHIQPLIQKLAGDIPIFAGAASGVGILTAGLVLALMILPFITAITRDLFKMTPTVLRESAYGMGATTWEVTRKVTIPYSITGIMGATFLGLGRALGETMAVTFVIGNNHHLSSSLFASGNSISSTLANEFTEASTSDYLSALIELGLVLLAISVIVQVIAQLWLNRVTRNQGGSR